MPDKTLSDGSPLTRKKYTLAFKAGMRAPGGRWG